MRTTVFGALVLAAMAWPLSSFAQRETAADSDAAIRRAIIADSISRYSGPCPCPYNSARNGSRCGKRSAYSRTGGYSPICYDTDITPQMIEEWRRSRRNLGKSAPTTR